MEFDELVTRAIAELMRLALFLLLHEQHETRKAQAGKHAKAKHPRGKHPRN